jgi:ribose 5-phosphate isomerase B
MKIVLASDHAGFEYKERLKLLLMEMGHVVGDCGAHSAEPIDYPITIRPAAEAVAAGEYERGIIFGGSGNGEAIVANRVPGIRCALCWNVESARLSREHNDANMLSMGQRMLDFDDVAAMVECWLETPFSGGRHLRRIQMIDKPGAGSHIVADAAWPHRADLNENARVVCDSCRQVFAIPVDILEGSSQTLLEKCPICAHENTILLQVDAEGALTVRVDQHITG